MPTLASRLQDAFPTPDQVPQEFRVDPRPYERLYLIDGQIRQWTADFSDISSPICLKQGATHTRPIIGHVPAMDPATAMKALDAASRAWDNGRGPWPTMPVSARIAAESGQLVTFDQALASNLDLAPGLESFTMDSPAPVNPDAAGKYPIAMPGQTKAM